jgi:hypothetical protein
MPSKLKFPSALYTLLLLTTACAALAQESATAPESAAENKPAVAVYVTGNVPDYMKTHFGKYLLAALINVGAAASDENTAAFLAVANQEQFNRNAAALNDSVICRLAQKFGQRYVCVASIDPAPGAFRLSARIMSAKTGQSRFNGETSGALATMEDLDRVSAILIEKMFGGKPVLGGQPVPTPEPAPVPAPKPTPVPEPPQTAQTPPPAAVAAPAAPISAPPAPTTETSAREAVNATPAVVTDPIAVNVPPTAVTPPAAVTGPITINNAAKEVIADNDDPDALQDPYVAPIYYDTSDVIKPPSMRVKNVAVVETEIDAQSGASGELTSADARLVTAELRREAVKNLPRGRYNVMTSETVYAQGSAVLEECADENCVIVLGSAIGADFIVRGIISKVQTLFTLSVEIYETDNGNLVASSDPIRSESLGDLLEKARVTCGEMYKTFVESYIPPPEPAAQEPSQQRKSGIDISVGAGGVMSLGFGGGVTWPDGGRIKMPYSGGGAYLYLDASYTEMFFGYTSGNGRWESPNSADPENLPYMPRACINAGLFAKFPFTLYGGVKLFPLFGLDYEASISGKIKNPDGSEYIFDGADDRPDANALSSLWFKAGAGIDFGMGKTMYLRSEFIYGVRAANTFESLCADRIQEVWAEFGQGFAVRIGIGAKF